MRSVRLRQIALIAGLLAILAVSAGCTQIGMVQHVGMDRSTDINFPYTESERPTQVTLNLGAAELQADSRGETLLEGTVEYNVADLEPDVTSGTSWVEVEQRVDRVGFLGLNDVQNDWTLHFGTEETIDLEINAGAYDGDWDLGGVPIHEMIVNQGASRSSFDFSEPNPVTMRELVFRTGAADLELLNLGNAGFRDMTFEGGASSYRLDFGGYLMRDAYVSVKAGVANIVIIIPEDTPASVSVSGLTNVDADRDFSRSGNSYLTPTWDDDGGSRLEIDIDAGLANVELVLKSAVRSSL